jgi:serine/threonine protein kinase
VKKLGKYELVNELGRGAMGIVYRARDPIINRLVALKTITAGLSDYPNLLQRFYREAQSAGGLQHPNIITIYDMGVESGTPYIAMELVEGQSLEQVIAARPTLPLSLKLTYAIQACRAFDYAHKRGIIHRDIKPANVMLSREGTVKVVDFGIARVLESSKTQTGMLLGTFAYMSPEQYHGEHADERSDLWSFGILLYELLCYRRPFTGEAPARLMHSICEEAPCSPSEVLSDCPPDLDTILQRLLRKSPAERYQSMEDLLLELDPICKSLQSETVAKLVEHSQQLVKQGEYSQARDALRQALQVESTNTQARILLEKVNTELKRILIRPKVQRFVEKGRALLEEGRIQEARAEAENALQLDALFEPAQELQRRVQQELDRSQLVAEYLEASKLRLADGMPEEAEALLSKVAELEPSNKLARVLQQQVIKEKAQRERRLRLLDTMQNARSLWTLQNYGECIQLLSELQQEFPHEEEIVRLLETAREDQAEQRRRQTLEKAHNLLAAGRHQECTAVLIEIQRQFPSDEEIVTLLKDVREDEADQRRLQGLAQARRLLAGRRYDECISLLSGLQQEFPTEPEIANLLDVARQDKAKQLRQQGIVTGRKLLAAHRYEECNVLLTDLQKQFPIDDEISKLLSAVRDEQAEQRKLQNLAEARNLLASRRYDESIALLTKLQQEYPDDDEISRLIETVRTDHAEQGKLRELARARNLLANGRYDESISLLTNLEEDFPNEEEIAKLLETARKDRAERQKQEKLAEARAHLASGRLAEALGLLETLRRAEPKDAGVQKLLALVQGEQEKQIQLERLQREWGILKALVGEKKYPEVITRAETLLVDFPGDADLVRLVEFARGQQTQIEREALLQKTCEKIKASCDGNRFQDAIRAAKEGLRTFPGNKQLLLLQEQAEFQDRKLQTRKVIEQRIRDIKVKINREKFSEAIELAKQTLVTLGPDTAVTQLLSSAVVEFEAREKKRKQEKEIESIRLLIQRGKFEEATQALDNALATQMLERFDPRVRRVSDEIHAATAMPTSASTPNAESAAPPLSKEYAWQQGPPPPSSADVAEASARAKEAPPQASADPRVLSSEPVAPLLPSEVSSAPTMQPVTPTIAPVPPAPPAHPAREYDLLPKEVVTVPEKRRAPRPVERPVTTPQRVRVPLWKWPAAIGGLVLASVVLAWMVFHIPLPSMPTVDNSHQAELQQRKAIEEADQFVAANDFEAALKALKTAAALNGPLKVDIDKKIAGVQNAIQNQQLRGLLQQEEKLWEQASDQVSRARFPEARVSIQQILGLPEGGRHRADAEQLRDVVIPRRQRESQLFAQAQKARQRGGKNNLVSARDLFTQVIALDGPLREQAQRSLNEVNSNIQAFDNVALRDRQIAALESGARQDLQRGDFRSSRQKAAQIRNDLGSDNTSLIAEIDRAERGRFDQLVNTYNALKSRDDGAAQQQMRDLQPQFQPLADGGGPLASDARTYVDGMPAMVSEMKRRAVSKRDEAAFQRAVQDYDQAKKANNKGGLEAVRSGFQSIAQGGGSHAGDAQKLVDEISAKLSAMNQPASPPLAPSVKAEPSSGAADRDAVLALINRDAVLALIKRYAQAFEQRNPDALRQIWPTLGNRYAVYKSSFESASSIRMQVQTESVKMSGDGTAATITAQFTEEYTPMRQKPRSVKGRTVFQVAKSNGTWVITDVQ